MLRHGRLWGPCSDNYKVLVTPSKGWGPSRLAFSNCRWFSALDAIGPSRRWGDEMS
jgi:hypothetical protein